MVASGPALADEVYCSGRGKNEYRMLKSGEPGPETRYVITHGSERQIWRDVGSRGTGMAGRVVQNGDEVDVVFGIDLDTDFNPTHPEKIPVFILQGRAFWPCSMQQQ